MLRSAFLPTPEGPPRRCVVAIVVHHRGLELLARCLETLLDSRGIELAVVVVANACPEPLPDVAGDPRVHVIRSIAPLGFSAANNRGVAWARAHLAPATAYFFVNNDTVTEPDTVARLLEVLETEPTVAIAGPRLMIAGTEDRLNSLGLNLTRTADAWDEGIGQSLADYGALPPRRTVLAVTGSALLARATSLEALAGWQELYHFYYEDVDLCLRAHAAGWEVVNVPQAVMWHAISATASRGSEFKLYHTWRNRLVLMAIHWPAGLGLAVAPRILRDEASTFLSRLKARAYADARVQLRSWAGFLRRLPRALALRRRARRREWTRYLWPAGAAPEIRLPPAREAAPAHMRSRQGTNG